MGVNDVSEQGVQELLQLAEATPRRLKAVSAAYDDTTLAQPPADDAWSPLIILHHLRACDEVWTHSIQAMLAHTQPALKENHPRRWIKTANPYRAQPFSLSLQSFSLKREALLLTLRQLALDDWERAARIDRRTHTVFSHVRRLVLHEQTHCDQLEAMLS